MLQPSDGVQAHRLTLIRGSNLQLVVPVLGCEVDRPPDVGLALFQIIRPYSQSGDRRSADDQLTRTGVRKAVEPIFRRRETERAVHVAIELITKFCRFNAVTIGKSLILQIGIIPLITAVIKIEIDLIERLRIDELGHFQVKKIAAIVAKRQPRLIEDILDGKIVNSS